ncbi:putative Swr1p complex component (Swc5) [Aspergillus thermomutatus]|uniref:SWR1-complex protein 5 n=1 Tax=Aspergillus thermomutatus TaxID=41047 RepID=A0A397GLU6_ASPTH|nr:swr complex subunit [Aspergillus thermomutatus]RHZ50023.1 swr complex subunit [Aspergillus thermomutatus]
MASDPTATVAELDFDNEQYDSAEDEDFQLDPDQEEADLTGSDSDDEATEPAAKRRKTGPNEAAAEDKEFDSGDEAMIQKVKARKENKQKGKKSKATASDEDEDDVDFDDDEEGGPGGFVRTRAMRMRMHEERKPLAKIDGATVDVDALWAQMNAPDARAGPLPSQTQAEDATPVNDENKDTDTADKQVPSTDSKPQYTEEMVKIKRTYKFAGETITEEKIVPKDSAEAKLFLANGESAETVTDADVEHAANAKDALKLRRPLRKISRFDPNPTGAIKKSWEKQPTAEITGQTENVSGPKINTVEKSRMDWAAYVDQAGIKDELKVHSKAKEGFLGRMDFLDRVGAKREEERRNARLKGL